MCRVLAIPKRGKVDEVWVNIVYHLHNLATSGTDFGKAGNEADRANHQLGATVQSVDCLETGNKSVYCMRVGACSIGILPLARSLINPECQLYLSLWQYNLHNTCYPSRCFLKRRYNSNKMGRDCSNRLGMLFDKPINCNYKMQLLPRQDF